MLLIYITLIAMLAMARKGRRRRRPMGRYIRGQVEEELDLGTLASKTLISQVFGQVVLDRMLLSSIVATWSMTAFTKSTGDGPIMVGIAHSDYSNAEIEAVIEAVDTWDEGNLVSRELSSRKVRRIGIFENPADEASAAVLNDGKPIKTKLNWILNAGQSLDIWAYNLGSSPLATTAPLVRADGHANLWPR